MFEIRSRNYNDAQTTINVQSIWTEALYVAEHILVSQFNLVVIFNDEDEIMASWVDGSRVI